jgi:hypothetical protein
MDLVSASSFRFLHVYDLAELEQAGFRECQESHPEAQPHPQMLAGSPCWVAISAFFASPNSHHPSAAQ